MTEYTKEKSTVEASQPVYVSEIEMGKYEYNPDLAKKRKDKINSIIKQTYNDLVAHTTQLRREPYRVGQTTTYISNRVVSLKDFGYKEFRCCSFVLNAANMAANTFYPLLVLKPGTVVIEDITFFGTSGSKMSSSAKILNNFGSFVFTKEDVTENTVISFATYDESLPSTSFGVFLTFLYLLDEDKL